MIVTACGGSGGALSPGDSGVLDAGAPETGADDAGGSEASLSDVRDGAAPGDASGPEAAGTCTPPAQVVDCSRTSGSPAMPTTCAQDLLSVTGDPIVAGPEPSGVFTGLADPSVRADPTTPGLFHLAYMEMYAETMNGATVNVAEIHLASGAGTSPWQPSTVTTGIHGVAPTNVLFPAVVGVNPASGASDVGYYAHELPTLTPVKVSSGVQWVSAHLTYFMTTQRGNGYPLTPDTFYIAITMSDATGHLGPSSYVYAQPTATGDAGAVATRPEQRLAGPSTLVQPAPDGTSAKNPIVRVSALSKHSQCTSWVEPALLQVGPALYLALECRLTDQSGGPVSVFSTTDFATDANPQDWSWSFVGDLFDPGTDTAPMQASVAAYDGPGTAPTDAFQVDLAMSKSGKLLAILNPTREPLAGSTTRTHLGCGFFELDPATFALKTQCGGSQLVLDAYVKNLDPEGASSCGYDPGLPDGVLAGRRPTTISGGQAQSIDNAEVSP
jgi:hypothetical protein